MTNHHDHGPNMSGILIRKASGEEQQFEKWKLERSLRNAGADEDLISEIVQNIERWISNKLTTKDIYKRAFSILRKKKSGAANRYRLKQAIAELGPTGYPFENFIGHLFEKQGYKVEVGQVIEGVCVTHEMDVIATNNAVQHLVECKYSSDQGKQISVQVPLYVRSRVNDIIEKRKNQPQYANLSFTGWVVTNTRFSSDSLAYGKCSGLHLLAWDYPQGNGLKELIEKFKMYPLTILNQLSKNDKQKFLNQGIVLCSQILENEDLLSELQLTPSKRKALEKEIINITS
jgi:hypothetical protein